MNLSGMHLDVRAVGTLPPNSFSHGDNSELVIEHCGPHVLLRHRDENPWERSVLTGYPVPPGDVVVLASAAAHRLRALPEILPSVLFGVLLAGFRPAGPAGPPSRINRVWLAVSDIGDRARNWANWLHRTAEQCGVEILAPHGRLVLVPGGTLFVEAQGGRSGWLRYRAGMPGVLAAARYPVPNWDAALPWPPVTADGLLADPVPAGLAVREAAGKPLTTGETAYAVPVHGQYAKLIVGRPGERPVLARNVAALIGQLRPALRGQLLVVPMTPELADLEWMRTVAGQLGQDVLFTPGPQLVDQSGAQQTIVFDDRGNQIFRPFPTILRQRPGQPAPEVLEVAPAPAGWSRCGPRQYRPDGTDSMVRAEVTPFGLHLGLATEPIAEPGERDPSGWTVTVGSPGRTITEPLAAGLERLLNGLTTDQRRTARVRVVGNLVAALGARLIRCAEHADVRLELAPSGNPPGEPDDQAPADVVAEPAGTSTEEPAEESTEVVRTPHLAPKPRTRSIAMPRKPVESDPVESPLSAPRTSAVPPSYLTATAVADRPSTPAEHERFVQEVAATLNEAPASWPSLRSTIEHNQRDPRAAKLDYMAVCLYLGSGPLGATGFNARLRAGEPFSRQGYLPCLISGLRQLPTHQRPVVRQARLSGTATQYYPVGATVTEPGFLSTSVATDVGVPGATVDFLVWPHSARRTAALDLARPFEEAVFFAGSRFRVLGVRNVAAEDSADDPHRPHTAVLLREVLPHEDTSDPTLTSTDREILSKLDRTLAERVAAPLRLLDDPDLSERLFAAPIGLAELPAPDLQPEAAVRSAQPVMGG